MSRPIQSHVLAFFAAITSITLAAELKPGALVDYSTNAFQPASWKERGLDTNLVPWTGEHLVFLTVDDKLDHQLMERWVSRLDAGWHLYEELTGRKPTPFKQIDGKASIAAVPSSELTCGLGCGYVGATGIELAMFYEHDYPMLQKNPKAMPHYVFYEMGRNYFTFGNRHSCFTTGFAVFMRYVCMDLLECEDPDAGTRKTIESVAEHFSGSEAGFLGLFTMATGIDEKAARVKNPAGDWISPSDQPVCYASAMLQLRRENGGDAWVKRFFTELALAPESPPAALEGARSQCWHWLLAASIAAGKDLSPLFAGEWGMPITAKTRAALGKIKWQEPDLNLTQLTSAITPDWQ
jgi:hypothetical protein